MKTIPGLSQIHGWFLCWSGTTFLNRDVGTGRSTQKSRNRGDITGMRATGNSSHQKTIGNEQCLAGFTFIILGDIAISGIETNFSMGS